MLDNTITLSFEHDKIANYLTAKRGIGETKKALEKTLEDKFGKYKYQDDDVFFVDCSEYKYLPDSPFEISGKILKRETSRGEEEIKEVPISKFFEERRSCFTIEFRIYVNKDIHDKNGKEIDDIIKETFNELFLGYTSAKIGATM